MPTAGCGMSELLKRVEAIGEKRLWQKTDGHGFFPRPVGGGVVFLFLGGCTLLGVVSKGNQKETTHICGVHFF